MLREVTVIAWKEVAITMWRETIVVAQMEVATTMWREEKKIKKKKMGPRCEPFIN